MAKQWWEKPLRVIQTNLQVMDTDKIEPQQLAMQMKQLGGNVLVFNVGGIYAWYPTKIPFHYVNEHLPEGRDLVQEVIEACHQAGIRFIARFDFSRADDSIYLRRPQWFVRRPDGEPLIVGEKRPGNWSLLMTACTNGPYRNDAVAVPVLEEFTSQYDIDGVFFNSPNHEPCTCENCRQKYRNLYREELPDSPNEYKRDWAFLCMRDNMEKWYATVKRVKPDLPLMLYYNPLYRQEMTDIMVTEPQDVLSRGYKDMPEFWSPALNLKLARSIPGKPAPLGIVHSSPGMDWRHTGLPPAEYIYWLSQVPGQGCGIWHSLTGIPETITDKRILETVKTFNEMLMKVEDHMEDAVPWSQTAVLWTTDKSAERWAEALFTRQVPFDVLLAGNLNAGVLSRYKVLILPEGTEFSEPLTEAVIAFVEKGGRLLAEGALPKDPRLCAAFGIDENMYAGGNLKSAYLRFEAHAGSLQSGMEMTDLIALRGNIVYCEPKSADTQVLATLVPPFAPVDATGRPPERASIPVARTDIPLVMTHGHGQGKTMYLPFSLSELMNAYKLDEHFRLAKNAVDLLLGDDKAFEATHVQGLQTTLFRNGGKILLHLVNGAGRRPLTSNIPLLDIAVQLKLDGRVKKLTRLVTGEALQSVSEGGRTRFVLPRLDVWECVLIEIE